MRAGDNTTWECHQFDMISVSISPTHEAFDNGAEIFSFLFSIFSFFLIFISEKILLTFWIKFVRKDCPVIILLEQVHRLLFADSMFDFLSLMLKPGLPNTA